MRLTLAIMPSTIAGGAAGAAAIGAWRRRARPSRGQIHLQRRQRLAQLVVDLARDARPFLLAHLSTCCDSARSSSRDCAQLVEGELQLRRAIRDAPLELLG